MYNVNGNSTGNDTETFFFDMDSFQFTEKCHLELKSFDFKLPEYPISFASYALATSILSGFGF